MTRGASFVADLCRVTGPRTLVRSTAYLLVMVVLFAPWMAQEITRVIPVGDDIHARVSLDIAIDRALCGRPSAISEEYDLAAIVAADPRLVSQPLRALAADRAGSVASYCASATASIMNNENS